LSIVAIYALQWSFVRQSPLTTALMLVVPVFIFWPNLPEDESWVTVLDALAFGIAMIIVSRVLLDLFFPDVVALSWRELMRVTLALCLTLTFSCLLGTYNHTFYNCHDFELAGWTPPDGCRKN